MEIKEKVKIRISEDAYNELLKMLSDNREYTHVKFARPGSCSNCSKIEIYLDNYTGNDYIEEKIDELPISYSKDLYKFVQEITLIYKNSSFMAKATKTAKTRETSCTSCNTCNKCNKSPQQN